MKYPQTFDCPVKANVPTPFELTVVPDWTGKLYLSAPCGCTSFQDKLPYQVEAQVPVKIKFVITKSQDYQGSITYQKLINGKGIESVGTTKLNVKING